MTSLLSVRQNVPQAFVSSYAPRIRTYNNSLLTPIPPNLPLVQSSRLTKRATTNINYAEDFENDDILDDSDAPRARGRGRLRMDDSQADRSLMVKELSKYTDEPVNVQAIWRDWMGKPKKNMTEKQVNIQASLPLNLVPIRIELSVAPYIPEPALPKPQNAREIGLDEHSPAYRQQEPTPEFKLKDYFLWNLHEALITPDQFAKTFVDEMDFPNERKQIMIMTLAQQIRTQLEEHAATELHPYFIKEVPRSIKDQNLSTKPVNPTSLPVDTPKSAPPLTNGEIKSVPPTITAIAEPINPITNPDDAHRCIITINLNLQNHLLTDKFEWSLLHPPGLPELFARQTCADLGLSREWLPALSHAIYEAVLKLKKEVVDNNGSLLGVVGSGINPYGEVENEVAEVHTDGAYLVGEGAGWRFDSDGLGFEWGPRLEMLSKEEIEKREGDRERQLRRMRRDMANRMAPQLNNRDSFYGGIENHEEERMGRGERAKRKRRFKSPSPVNVKDNSNDHTAFGEIAKLNESERQVWRCTHCKIWGSAVWGVRSGPLGPKSLCHCCGLLYDMNKVLPPWNQGLYAGDRDYGTVGLNRPIQSQPAAAQSTLTSSTSSFRQNPSRYINNNNSSFLSRAYQPLNTASSNYAPTTTSSFSNPPLPHASLSHSPLPPPSHPSTLTPGLSNHIYHNQALTVSGKAIDIHTATLRGGGPQMFENYAVEGEDLDWTKVADPRERKRLQNIINGRKYRERRGLGERTSSGIVDEGRFHTDDEDDDEGDEGEEYLETAV